MTIKQQFESVKDDSLRAELLSAMDQGRAGWPSSSLQYAINAGINEWSNYWDEIWKMANDGKIETTSDHDQLPQTSDELKRFIKSTVEAFYPNLKQP